MSNHPTSGKVSWGKK